MNLAQEIRVLNSAADLIEKMVNNAVCCLPDDREEIAQTVLPKNHISAKYFFILLQELIAGVNKEMVPDKEDGENLIDLLAKVAKLPKLDANTRHLGSLEKSTNEFNSWLTFEFEYEIYSAQVRRTFVIRLARREALYLIGNRCKHTLTRSNVILQKLVRIYERSGINVSPSEEILLLEDIDTWLLDDFGGYHFTKLCELCSNVHHGIDDYVGPVLDSRTERRDNNMYTFKVPDSLLREDQVFEFYELLNRFRSQWIPRISTSSYLQEKY